MKGECLPTDLSNIANVRRLYRIGLLGTYGRRKGLIEGGKFRLRKDGFPFSFLIKDFPDVGRSVEAKSQHYLPWMNLVFFVFAFRCDNSSVSHELDNFVKAETGIPVVAMIEMNKRGEVAVHTLTKEILARAHSLSKVYFYTEVELREGLSKSAVRCSHELFEKLKLSFSERIRFLETIGSCPVYSDRLCDLHRTNNAMYVCVERCLPTCRISHLCYADVLTDPEGTVCQRKRKQVFKVCAPELPRELI